MHVLRRGSAALPGTRPKSPGARREEHPSLRMSSDRRAFPARGSARSARRPGFSLGSRARRGGCLPRRRRPCGCPAALRSCRPLFAWKISRGRGSVSRSRPAHCSRGRDLEESSLVTGTFSARISSPARSDSVDDRCRMAVPPRRSRSQRFEVAPKRQEPPPRSAVTSTPGIVAPAPLR